MRASLIAVVVLGCKYSEPMVGDDAPRDTILPEGFNGCAVVEIASGGDHSCARLVDGTTTCWGSNDSGEIGVAAQTNCSGTPCNPTPVQVPLSNVMALGLGIEHTCALTAAGVFCWGANGNGEFGDGTTTSSETPALISSRAGTEVLVAGEHHTCSLKAGAVLCSGKNEFGEIGDGSVTTPQLNPTPALLSLVTVVKVGTGSNHLLAIGDDGNLYGWGRNVRQQLQNVASTSVNPPIVMPGVTASTIVAGGASHTCVLQATDHIVRCRGDNLSGQIGTGFAGGTGAFTTTVVPPPMDEVAAGGAATCVRIGGTVKCFGAGYGPTPVTITLPHPATSIALGTAHGCALVDDRSVWCWGDNTHGQLGDGTTTSHQVNPVPAVCR